VSTQIPVLQPLPADGAAADGRVTPARAGVAHPIGTARVAGAGPEVYCRMHGAAYAAKGFASCTELGCGGCARRD
jgi:hypothetical protein